MPYELPNYFNNDVKKWKHPMILDDNQGHIGYDE